MPANILPFGSHGGNVFSDYCKIIAENHCPFLKASENLEAITQVYVNCQEIPAEKREFWLLQTAWAQTLRFASFRLKLHPQAARLACLNVILVNEITGLTFQSLVEWPHFFLKLNFAKHGIVFGKFWLEEKEQDRYGSPIPSSPVNFLSIRTLVHLKDARFFSKTPELIPDLSTSFTKDLSCLPACPSLSTFEAMKQCQRLQFK